MSKYKSGLDYFSFDIDFFNDQKVEFVSAKYGIEGEIITIKLLCKIYRDGYYLNWGEDECLLFSKKVGENISSDLVKNVINELLKRDFFNQDLYKKFSILTSKGIQKRYLEASKRRKEVIFHKEYYLLNNLNIDILPDNVNIIPLNVDINPQNVDIIPQSKVKESKVKEKREYAPLVLLTEEEHQKLVAELGDPLTKEYITRVSLYCQSKGKRYKSYYATILNWHRKDVEEGKVKKPADDEAQPKHIMKREPKLTPEQVARDKARLKELANQVKCIGNMPGTAKGS